MCEYGGLKLIVVTEGYNALYVNGQLAFQAKSDYLDGETLHTIFHDAEYYGAYDLEEDIWNGDGYPELLSDLDLTRCEKFWPR